MADRLAGRVLNGRYELQGVLGGGGMALVYRALDRVLNRTVAVKVLREQYATDPTFLQRFTREAQAAAALSHPNIVSVYDVGQDGDVPYIVMEYVLRIKSLRVSFDHDPHLFHTRQGVLRERDEDLTAQRYYQYHRLCECRTVVVSPSWSDRRNYQLISSFTCEYVPGLSSGEKDWVISLLRAGTSHL